MQSAYIYFCFMFDSKLYLMIKLKWKEMMALSKIDADIPKENNMKQLTYIMVKPEFAEKEEVIELVKKEAREAGMEILREKFVKYSVELAQKHYAEHFRGSYENAKGFYMTLENYITSGRAYGMVMEGENAIETMRAVIKRLRGVVPPVSDDPEVNLTKNVLHGSDCEESAEKEIAIFDSMDEYDE